MNKYEEGKIYCIKCKINPDYMYIGSTLKTLEERWKAHKITSNQDKTCGRLLYKTINNEWDNWYIELIKLYPCNSKNELTNEEGNIIKELGNLNQRIPGLSRKETIKKYISTDKYKEYQKQYRINKLGQKKK
jgi:hypothetical protein